MNTITDKINFRKLSFQFIFVPFCPTLPIRFFSIVQIIKLSRYDGQRTTMKRKRRKKTNDEVIKGDKVYGARAARPAQRDETMWNLIMTNFPMLEKKVKQKVRNKMTKKKWLNWVKDSMKFIQSSIFFK